MDAFKVPKKVNRHVLKALNFLSRNNDNVPTSQILQQVKYQMRNLVPVPNIDMVIQKSLKNLSDIGLIDRTAPQRFAIGRSYVPTTAPKPNKPKTTPQNLFKPSGSRKRSFSQLDPNAKRAQYDSEDSLSGDEYDRARKLMRTNNKRVNYMGRSTELPKAKQHYRFKTITLARTSPLNIMDYQNDSDFEQNLEMAVYIGPKENSNTAYNLSSISPSPPLEITEIVYNSNDLNNLQTNEQQQDLSKEFPLKVVELYSNSKSNIDDNDSNEQQSKTSVNTNLTPNIKSKTSVSSLEIKTNEN